MSDPIFENENDSVLVEQCAKRFNWMVPERLFVLARRGATAEPALVPLLHGLRSRCDSLLKELAAAVSKREALDRDLRLMTADRDRLAAVVADFVAAVAALPSSRVPL